MEKTITPEQKQDNTKQENHNEDWDWAIKPKRGALNIDLKAIWHYRDLLLMFIKRDIVTVYKQTILGPVWYVMQPILMTGMFTFVFGGIANISTDGLPHVLFYFSGVVIWNYFKETFNTTSTTFKQNANIFDKVYFPRLIMPLAKTTSGLIKFGIQFVLFLGIIIYFLFFTSVELEPNFYILLLPVFLMLMAGLGLGAGMIFTSLTAKYRDLTFVLQFGVQLLMYASPVIYPVSTIPEDKKIYIMANPMTPVLEGFKYAFLGVGTFELWHLAYTAIIAGLLLLFGIMIFNKTEKNFIDTV